MLLSFAEHYRKDLQMIQKDFEKALSPWWNDLKPKFDCFKDDFTFTLLPALSLAIDDYLDLSRNTSLAMANIVRVFYFGHHIHESVPDDEEKNGREAEVQFSILVGDYILGKVLHLLTEAELEMLLDIFAEMIAEMNEGLVVKYHFKPDYIDMLTRSRMPLYASLALSAATVAKQPEHRKLLFKDLGFHYGMAAELMDQGGFLKEAHWHLFHCEEIFGQINKCPSYINSSLEKAIRDLRLILDGQNEKAATL